MPGGNAVMRVNGVDLNIMQAGTGAPTLVLLHYWGGSSRTWAPAVHLLQETNRCVAIDFRGWGGSARDAADHSLATLADDVVGIVRGLGLERFVLIGHSMGGKVAQLVAARRPAGLERLILVAPAPPTPLAVPREQREAMLASYQTREGAESVVGILSGRELSPALREQVVEDTFGGAPDAKSAWTDEGMTQDVAGEAAGIEVPVVVIVGQEDRVEREDALRASFSSVLTGVGFTVLPGVGHLAPLEAPAELVEAIRAAIV